MPDTASGSIAGFSGGVNLFTKKQHTIFAESLRIRFTFPEMNFVHKKTAFRRFVCLCKVVAHDAEKCFVASSVQEEFCLYSCLDAIPIAHFAYSHQKTYVTCCKLKMAVYQHPFLLYIRRRPASLV
jgi:hypothetical protein